MSLLLLLYRSPQGTPRGSYWGPHFPRRSRGRRSYWGSHFPDPDLGVILSPAPQGVASFAMRLEEGARLTLTWSTGVSKSESGAERRSSNDPDPDIALEGDAILVGDDAREARARIARYAALGSVFSIGAPWEEITLAADAVGNTLNVVRDPSETDWAEPGVRAIVWHPDHGGVAVTVQSSTATTLDVYPQPGACGNRGGVVMPAIQSYLDPQQTISRFPVGPGDQNAERWSVSGVAAVPGFLDENGDPVGMGTGATLTTFGGRVVWDRGVNASNPVADMSHSLTEIVSLGSSRPYNATSAGRSDWARQVGLAAPLADEWQWFKLFLWTVRGRWKSWWLPTWRADLESTATAAGTITVYTSAAKGDLYAWAPLQRDHLQVRHADESLTYCRITAIEDNGDGTATLSVVDENDDPISWPASAVTMVSWLEKCRLESDTIVVEFTGGAVFKTTLVGRVVQQ